MSYGDMLQDAFEAISFKTGGIRKILGHPDALAYGLLTTALAGVATAIGSLQPFGLILNPIGLIIGLAIGVGIIHLLAKLFGGTASYSELFKVMSNTQLVYWVTVIPFIGPFLSPLVGLFYLVFGVFAVREIHDVETWKAIVIVLLPVVIVTILLFVLAALAAFIGLGALGLGLGSMAVY